MAEKLSTVKVSLLNDDIGIKDALFLGEQENKTDSIFNYEEDEELNM